MSPEARTLLWTEYRPERYPPGAIPAEVPDVLHRRFRDQVSVRPPWHDTGDQWEFTPQGWVGTIPVTEGVTVSIRPKAALANVFQMWEYAYRLRGFKFLDGVVGCESLADFYQNLASIFSRRVLDRSRRGLYRAYLGRSDRLPYVSGRLDVRRMASMPWRVDLHCSFEEHTADVEENQLLCCTLSVVARSGLCSPAVLNTVRRAYRELLGCASPAPLPSSACVGRIYNRLNEDYEPLHGLCRFFLEHRSPHHDLGDRSMMPFLVDMARLYELFVAEWLRLHLPPELELKAQHAVHFGSGDELRFQIDLLILDRETRKPLFVLDTKYKVPDAPSAQDIHEVRSYAEALGCPEAVLVYPEPLPKARDVVVGKIRVRSLTFATGGDLEAAGRRFLHQVLESPDGGGQP